MKNRTRCHFIGIYSPQDDAQKRVTWCRETILEDDAGSQIGKADKQPPDLTANFADIAATTHTVTDPVTGQSVTFSAAALALWLGVDFDARQAAADAVAATTTSTGDRP